MGANRSITRARGAALAGAMLLVSLAATRTDAAAVTPIQAGDHQETLAFGGLTRSYIVHVPPTFDRAARAPLVIMLHGAGGSGAGAEPETGWNVTADREGFLVAYPDGTPSNLKLPASFLLNPRIWNDGSGRGAMSRNNIDDSGFIAALIGHLEQSYGADPARIYLTGFSNGASMTYAAGVRLSDRIAAIAPVSGHLWLKDASLASPVPLLFIIGTDDPLNPIAGGDVKLPWGGAQYHPPVEASLRAWRKMLGCTGDGRVALDQNGVKERVWDRCAKGGEVRYYTVAGLGHVWPGGLNRLPQRWVGSPSDKLDATGVIWAFFKSHPKAR